MYVLAGIIPFERAGTAVRRQAAQLHQTHTKAQVCVSVRGHKWVRWLPGSRVFVQSHSYNHSGTNVVWSLLRRDLLLVPPHHPPPLHATISFFFSFLVFYKGLQLLNRLWQRVTAEGGPGHIVDRSSICDFSLNVYPGGHV